VPISRGIEEDPIANASKNHNPSRYGQGTENGGTQEKRPEAIRQESRTVIARAVRFTSRLSNRLVRWVRVHVEWDETVTP